MSQRAVIVEWFGPYDTLEAVREANENGYVLCMALGEGAVEGDASRYRYIATWANAEPPADGPLNDADNQSFYLGWVVSFGLGEHAVSCRAKLETAKWALVHALRTELNDQPDPYPPGWVNGIDEGTYCGSVCSWFYSGEDNNKKINSPTGFPTVLTFNSPEYDCPPDGERVLRLRLVGRTCL